MNIKLQISLLSFCLLGVAFLVYYQMVFIPEKLERCNTIAINLEKERHSPADDLQVTNQDIASYMKNIVACFTL